MVPSGAARPALRRVLLALAAALLARARRRGSAVRAATAGGPGTPAATGSPSSPVRRRRSATDRDTPVDDRTPRPASVRRRRSCERAVLRLPLLPPREQRRGDEDRRVRTDEQTGGEREREVLERGRADDAGADDQQRQHRQQRDERRRQRPHQHLRSATGSPSRRRSTRPVAVSVRLVLPRPCRTRRRCRRARNRGSSGTR